jgi:hypothetical protein
MGIRRQVKALLCPRLSVPATIGIVRPVIMLPEQATDWSEDRMSVVLIHELAHIRRCDWLWQSLSQLACAIHVFNPLVWLGANRQRAESELAGDDLVIQYGIEPTTYASQLLDIARSINKKQVPAAICMARKPTVEHRLKAIIDRTRRREGLRFSLTLGTIGVSALIIVPLGIALPSLINRVVDDRSPTLNIPSIPSKEIEPSVFLAQDGVAQLPNGLKVRLVAISQVGENPSPWSVLDHSITDLGPFKNQGEWHRYEVGRKSAFSRKLVFAYQSSTDLDISTTGGVTEITLPEGKRGYREFATKISPQVSRLSYGNDISVNGPTVSPQTPVFGDAVIEMVYALANAKAWTYRLGIATGAWKEVYSLNAPFWKDYLGRIELIQGTPSWYGNQMLPQVVRIRRPSNSNVAPTTYRLLLCPRQVNDGENNAFSDTEASRVLLYDRHGKKLKTSGEIWARQNARYVEVDAKTLDQCIRIVVQTRPYQWIEFRDIPVHPELKSLVVQRAANPPVAGFQKLTSDGSFAATVDSVQKAVFMVRLWTFNEVREWKPDGTEILDAPYDKTPASYDEKRWGKLPLYRFKVFVSGDSKVVNSIIKAEGALELPRGQVSYVENGPGLLRTNLVVPFKSTAQEATLKVGIAAGPWKTVATCPVALNEFSQVEPDLATSSHPVAFNGFKIELGSIPKVIVSKNNRTQEHVLVSRATPGQEARQFVALLRNGTSVVIHTTAVHPDYVQQATIMVGHKNRLNAITAEDIKEIQLQTRPYEWLTFEHVALRPKGSK